MASSTVTIRLDNEILRQIDDACGGFSSGRGKWIKNCVLDYLGKPLDAGLSIKDKIENIENSDKIDKLVDSGILEAIRENPGVFKSLTPKELATAAIARSPKDKNSSADLEMGVMSLQEILNRMPKIEDVCAELARVKGELFKSKNELYLATKIQKIYANRKSTEEENYFAELKKLYDEVALLSKKTALEFSARGMVFKNFEIERNKLETLDNCDEKSSCADAQTD